MIEIKEEFKYRLEKALALKGMKPAFSYKENVMKAIYRHTLADQEKRFVEITNSAFSQF